MNVSLVHITQNAEQLIADIARVSTGKKGAQYKGLFTYMIEHGHWSPFEMASMCIEIETSRAIGRQILRHRSFSFQEFSQRYAEATSFEKILPRREHDKNRQSSIDDLNNDAKTWWDIAQTRNEFETSKLYEMALKLGISKETARFLLPETSSTRMYMHGTIRSWIHYLRLRIQEDVQLEHRDIADAIKEIFIGELPKIGEIVFEKE